MKAIILAAGRGSRMTSLTNEKPKCLIEVAGKPIIEYQLEAFSNAGISDICIVTGYMYEKLSHYGKTSFHNALWDNTNMVYSLMCASEWLQSDDCIISYSDIIFEPSIISKLMNNPDQLAVAYDVNWLDQWSKRFSDPLVDAESFKLNTDKIITNIGNKCESIDEIDGQYMGLVKFSKTLWDRYSTEKIKSDFNTKYMTDLLQHFIDENLSVRGVPNNDPWFEFDSENDLEVYTLHTSEKMNFERVLPFLERNYLKNRTIVSADIESILLDIKDTSGLPFEILSYPSGATYSTWDIPPQWDVNHAYIKDSSGKILADYNESPLFLSPYSCPVSEKLSYDELLEHYYRQDNQPEAFCYNHRVAYDYKKRLKDWTISFPRSRLNNSKGPYEVEIDVSIKAGELLIGEVDLKGDIDDTILFIADYCHPAQINDSFSGLVLFMELMQHLQSRSKRRYSYRCIFVPETIGTAVYFAENELKRKNIKTVIFSDNVAWGEQWFFKQSRLAKSYFDQVASLCRHQFKDLNMGDFYKLIGNDELTTDTQQINIPSLSLQKYFFEEYHTSLDNLDRLNREDLNYAFQIMKYYIDILETDSVYEYVHDIPFYLTKFGLYSDSIYKPLEFQQKREILNSIDGSKSCVEIAFELDLPYEQVKSFMDKMFDNELIRISNKGLL